MFIQSLDLMEPAQTDRANTLLLDGGGTAGAKILKLNSGRTREHSCEEFE